VTRPPVIAIDGTAASGKGTIAKALARHFGFDHLDTGALYRSVAALVLQAGGDPASRHDAMEACERFQPGIVPDAELRTAQVGEAASLVSAVPEVRQRLRQYQTGFAAQPPGGRGAVIDGRDIGTVICPDAPVKLFVTATVEERSRRRWRELDALGKGKPYEHLLEDLRARDARDADRPISPMKPANDALLLDTTDLSIDEAVRRALELTAGKVGG
jgi:cytidylate kinase